MNLDFWKQEQRLNIGEKGNYHGVGYYLKNNYQERNDLLNQ